MKLDALPLRDSLNSQIKQAFYTSKQFLRLEVETMDIRMHSILGGISSTRWFAYRRFKRSNQSLLGRLSKDEPCQLAIKITKKTGRDNRMTFNDLGIVESHAKNMAIQVPGMVSGDGRNNVIRGSVEADILIGNGGKDRLTGLGGGDLLSGGRGADYFVFKLKAQQGSGLVDTITDFNGEQGDRIKIKGAETFAGSTGFSGQPGEVNFVSWIVDLMPGSKFKPHIHQGGMISADSDGDGSADLMIELPGVVSVDSEWILFA